MVGGEERVYAKVKDLLLTMGSSAVLVGKIGNGNVAKLVNQVVVALNIAAVSEAFVLASKTGVDPGKVYTAIRGGLAGSTMLDAKVPRILKDDFQPGFRIELHIKDLKNAIETAHAVGVSVPLSSQVMEIMQALKVDEREKDNHGGLIQYYEKLAGIEVRECAVDN